MVIFHPPHQKTLQIRPLVHRLHLKPAKHQPSPKLVSSWKSLPIPTKPTKLNHFSTGMILHPHLMTILPIPRSQSTQAGNKKSDPVNLTFLKLILFQSFQWQTKINFWPIQNPFEWHQKAQSHTKQVWFAFRGQKTEKRGNHRWFRLWNWGSVWTARVVSSGFLASQGSRQRRSRLSDWCDCG